MVRVLFRPHEGIRTEAVSVRFSCCAVERMECTAPICIDEFERVKRLTVRTAKTTMPSPSAFHFFRGDQCRDATAYPDLDAWWADLIAVYQAEIRDLAAAGCKYLQIQVLTD